MQRFTVARNVCDMYKDGSQSELVSQAIMGQTVQVAFETDAHMHVHTHDRYKGHLRKHCLVPVTAEAVPSAPLRMVRSLTAPVFKLPKKTAELQTVLVLSTTLAVVGQHRQYDLLALADGRYGYVKRSLLSLPVRMAARRLTERSVGGITRRACSQAKELVGTPYLWGGSTPFGIDCSGFTQLCYRMAGFQLLRDAVLQIDDARFGPVAFADQLDSPLLQAGDLVFFGQAASGETPRKVTHVGMILKDGRMIHSAGGFGVVIENRHRHRLAGSFLGARRLKVGACTGIHNA